MMPLFAFIVVLTFVVVNASGSFNAEELTSAIYDVDILGEPKLATEMASSPTSMLLLSKHGQRYECQLPSNSHTLAGLPELEPALKDEKPRTKSTEENAQMRSSLVGIPRLLDDMAEGDCLRLNKGWWEYEFCFRKRIRQYHVNEQSGAIENESVLGEFVSDLDWSTVNVDESNDDSASGKRSAVRLHSQAYAGGSTCDLTGLARRAEVQFHCDPTPHAGDSLVDVEEPASCVYRLTVRTGRLCEHPLLRRAAEERMPSHRKPPESIQCRPLLQPESMQRYQKAQAAKRLLALKAEELAKLRAIQRQNPLRRLARIRHVLTGRLAGPLRRRKLAEMARRRRQRLQRKLASAAKAVTSAEGVLDSASLFSRSTEASLKWLTKDLKKKFLATGGADGRANEAKAPASAPAAPDEDAAAIKKALKSFPEKVRRKLSSRRGLETLRSGIGAQFQQMMEEAQREVGERPGAAFNDGNLIGRMSEMLNKIISQVDEAGRQLDKEQKGIELETVDWQRGLRSAIYDDAVASGKAKEEPSAAKAPSSTAKPTGDAALNPPSSTGDADKKSPGVLPSEQVEAKPKEAEQEVTMTKNRKKKIKSKRMERIVAEAKQEASRVESINGQEMEKLRGKLEAGIREKMERRGIETNGLTLHLMSLGAREGEDDADSKSKSFVGIIFLKNDRHQQEQERMRRMEENYNFRPEGPPDPLIL